MPAVELPRGRACNANAIEATTYRTADVCAESGSLEYMVVGLHRCSGHVTLHVTACLRIKTRGVAVCCVYTCAFPFIACGEGDAALRLHGHCP